ncbi:hypothetical protein [Streptomyces sp. NPDC048357]|uniref:hypothetical protein n=1 Tax=Streptomyces sp. NPDC048357 TaxID=3154719 RepID=UPI0034322915
MVSYQRHAEPGTVLAAAQASVEKFGTVLATGSSRTEVEATLAAAARAVLPKSKSVWVPALTTLTAGTGHGTVVTISVLYFTRRWRSRPPRWASG